jgi:hypothetical protein
MAYGTVNADVIGTSVTGSNLGAGNASIMKNRIINGAMVISQRYGTSSSTMTSNVYSLDRYFNYFSSSGTATVQQSTTAPAGFTNSMLYTVGTADTSVGAGDYVEFEQRIEGYNVGDLGFGTASAKTITVSFWVRSALTGTYCINLRNSANNRAYIAEYTISVANTWEQKSITIAGDTTGTWLTDNSTGLTVGFALMAGSTYQQTAGSWGATSYGFASSNQVNWMATSGNTFYITGVQLEVGSSATGFEYRQYGTELALCERYSYVTNPNEAVSTLVTGSNTSDGILQFPVTMRSVPTLTTSGAMSGILLQTYNDSQGASNVTINIASLASARLSFTAGTGAWTAGQAGRAYFGWSGNGQKAIFSAEL